MSLRDGVLLNHDASFRLAGFFPEHCPVFQISSNILVVKAVQCIFSIVCPLNRHIKPLL